MALNEKQQSLFFVDQAIITGGPGTGKTHCIIEKIKNLINEKGIEAKNIIFFTPYLKSSKSLEMQLEEENLTDIFFKSALQFSKELLGESFLQVFDDKTKFWDNNTTEKSLGKLIESNNQNIDELHLEKITDKLRELRQKFQVQESDIKLVYERCKDVCNLRTKKKPEFNLTYEQFKNVFSKYCEEVSGENKDYCEIISSAISQLQDTKNHSILTENFSYLFIDNIQDSDDITFSLILELCKLFKGKVWIAGDLSQKIKKHLITEINVFEELKKLFPKFKAFHLQENYRSSIAVVEACNKLIPENKLIARSKEKGEIVYKEFKEIDAESKFIASEIQKLVENNPESPLNIAIFNSRKSSNTTMQKKLEEQFKLQKTASSKQLRISKLKTNEKSSQTFNLIFSLLYFWSFDFDSSYANEIHYFYYFSWATYESKEKIKKTELESLNEYWRKTEIINLSDSASLPSKANVPSLKKNAVIELDDLIKKLKAVKVSNLDKNNAFSLVEKLWNAAELTFFKANYKNTSTIEKRKINAFIFEKLPGLKLNDLNKKQVMERCMFWLQEKAMQSTNPKKKDEFKKAIYLLSTSENTGLKFDYVFLCGLVETYTPDYYSLALNDEIGINICKNIFYKCIGLTKQILYAFFTPRKNAINANRSRFLTTILN